MKVRTFQPDDYGNMKLRQDGEGEWVYLDDYEALDRETSELILKLRNELNDAHRLIATSSAFVEVAIEQEYGTCDYENKKVKYTEPWLKEFMKFNTRDIP